MDSFEWNKIFAALLSAVLASQLIKWGTEALYHNEPPEEAAYSIQVADASSAEEDEPEDTGPTFAELMQDASARGGERSFRKCQACHKVQDGSAHATGPDLYNVVGTAIASKDGYSYSSAIKGLEGAWTYEKLDAWLTDPQSVAGGTKMVMKVGRPDERADIIAYLAENSENPPPLPQPEAAADNAEADDAGDEAGEEG